MARTRHAPGQGSWLLSLRRMVLAGSFGRGSVVLRWRLRSPAVERGTYAPNDRLRQHQWRRRPGSRCLRLTSQTPGQRRNAAVFCHSANPRFTHDGATMRARSAHNPLRSNRQARLLRGGYVVHVAPVCQWPSSFGCLPAPGHGM